jgi:lysophospholipase L1-like esterase
MMTRLLLALTTLFAWLPPALAAGPPSPRELLTKSRRVVFLGDSITAAGPSVAFFDAWLASQRRDGTPKVINAGLPSETVSGLSEEGHAGGKFPRPDLAERLDRVLDVAKPDLVIACYGMNCGIYQPFDEERFARYQKGMAHLKSRVEKAGAQLILVTPPFYDDQRAPKAFSYNAVLDRYGEWLLGQRKEGWTVIDLHGPMTREVLKRRERDPNFTLQPDGVHPNEDGHWLIAQQVIAAFGDEKGGRGRVAEADAGAAERARVAAAAGSTAREPPAGRLRRSGRTQAAGRRPRPADFRSGTAGRGALHEDSRSPGSGPMSGATEITPAACPAARASRTASGSSARRSSCRSRRSPCPR